MNTTSDNTAADAMPVFRQGALWKPLRDAAVEGRLVLQHCADCGRLQYPPRELCRGCLSAELAWRPAAGRGAVLSWTRVHVGIHPFFRERGPWTVGAIALDCGALASGYEAWLYAYLSEPCLRTGAEVRIHPLLNTNGEVVFVATSPEAGMDEFDKIHYLTQEPSS